MGKNVFPVVFYKKFDFGIFGLMYRHARGTGINTPHVGTKTIVDYYTKQKYDPVPFGFRSEIHRKDPNHDKLDKHLKETDNPVFLGLGTINYYYQDNAVCIV